VKDVLARECHSALCHLLFQCRIPLQWSSSVVPSILVTFTGPSFIVILVIGSGCVCFGGGVLDLPAFAYTDAFIANRAQALIAVITILISIVSIAIVIITDSICFSLRS
jgi:hypothetical protein